MPEPEQEQRQDEGTVPARRFKLPKLFADASTDVDDRNDDNEPEPAATKPNLLASASALGATLASAGSSAADDAGADVRATVLSIPTQEMSRENDASKRKNSRPAARPEAAGSSGGALDVASLHDEISTLQSDISDITRILLELNERNMAQDKVFNTLHSELQDYKNDFLYEHLKPVVRPLLFLFDSLEQFDDELNAYERSAEQERRGGITTAVVRANVMFFREQLVEALRICEVTPMYDGDDKFDPKMHKAIEVVPVDTPNQDNLIQRVVKSGWYLNGRVFRPAEVVVGKYSEDRGVQI